MIGNQFLEVPLRKNIQANIPIPEGGLTIDENLIKNSGIAFVDLPVTETQAEEQKEEKQPLKKRIRAYLLNIFKQIKSKLWRLLLYFYAKIFKNLEKSGFNDG